MVNLIQIVELGCILGVLIASIAMGYLWIVN